MKIMSNIKECEYFSLNDDIICIDDKSTINITLNNRYRALSIYKYGTISYVQIIDDNNHICSYKVYRFLNISKFREYRFSTLNI